MVIRPVIKFGQGIWKAGTNWWRAKKLRTLPTDPYALMSPDSIPRARLRRAIAVRHIELSPYSNWMVMKEFNALRRQTMTLVLEAAAKQTATQADLIKVKHTIQDITTAVDEGLKEHGGRLSAHDDTVNALASRVEACELSDADSTRRMDAIAAALGGTAERVEQVAGVVDGVRHQLKAHVENQLVEQTRHQERMCLVEADVEALQARATASGSQIVEILRRLEGMDRLVQQHGEQATAFERQVADAHAALASSLHGVRTINAWLFAGLIMASACLLLL